MTYIYILYVYIIYTFMILYHIYAIYNISCIYNISLYIYINKTPGNKDAFNFSNYRGESPDLLKEILAVFSALFLAVGRSCLAFTSPLTFDDGKGRRLILNCLTNCCMKLI